MSSVSCQQKAIIVFRTDASIQIGTGHVMRCLTLADALRKRGVECLFVCRPHVGHLLDLIARRGHHVVALPELSVNSAPTKAGITHAQWLGTDWASDAFDTQQILGEQVVDWIVVDHYALDVQWERRLRPMCKQLMVIDDLADRKHDCDLLLDQNLGRVASDYSSLMLGNATILVGPQYALLRPEFAEMRAKSLMRRRNPQLKSLLIFMGGMDKGNATGCVLDSLQACALPSKLQITVVMGDNAPWLKQVKVQASKMKCPTKVMVSVNNMSRLMADSDLAIGAAGSTSWERCCLGLPTIQFVLAANQTGIANALASASAVLTAKAETLCKVLTILFVDTAVSKELMLLSHAARTVTDGLGAVRVVTQILGEKN